MSVYDSPDKVINQVSLYAARGTLIESEGPSWFYGTGSEHSVLYQYQVYGAKDVSRSFWSHELVNISWPRTDSWPVYFRSISVISRPRLPTSSLIPSLRIHSTHKRHSPATPRSQIVRRIAAKLPGAYVSSTLKGLRSIAPACTAFSKTTTKIVLTRRTARSGLLKSRVARILLSSTCSPSLPRRLETASSMWKLDPVALPRNTMLTTVRAAMELFSKMTPTRGMLSSLVPKRRASRGC